MKRDIFTQRKEPNFRREITLIAMSSLQEIVIAKIFYIKHKAGKPKQYTDNFINIISSPR